MTDLTVKHFNSGMTGAPQISNNWGDLVTMLDACLVNGFALKAIDTLTSVGGVATATITSGHAYLPNQVVLIAGAEQPEYNGSHQVLATTMTTFTYAVTGSPVSPATTTTSLSAKVASLGWEKPFGGTNKAAYRSKNPQSPQNILLIDDSLKTPGFTTDWAKWANVGIVEDLSDIDTIVGAQAPYDPNNPTQNWKQVQAGQWGWHKWYHARQGGYENYGDSGGGNRNWVLVGDDRLFYLFVTNAAGFGWYGRNSYCFGDITSFKPGDNYATVLCADDIYWSNSNSGYSSYPGQYNGYGLISSLDFAGKVLLRNHTQLGNPVRWATTSLNTNNGQQICGRGPMPFPNGADYSLWLLPTYVRQEDGHTFNVGQRLILRCEVIVGAFDANGVPWARLIQFKAGGVLMFQVGDAAYRGKLIPGVFLYGATARVHAIAGDTPSGLPAFPATVGVNAADDLLPLAGGSTSVLPDPAANIGVNADCDLMRLNSPSSELWSRGGGYDWHFRAIPNGRKDIHFSGHGVIVGTVKEKGQPDQPLVRRVQLISENTRVLVAETWSDTTGAYRFELIDPAQRYTVVSYDHKQMYRAVIADNLHPEMMP